MTYKKTKYEEYSLKLSDNQKDKIIHAIKNNEGVTIRIEDNGDDKIALTQSQVNKINKAFQEGKAVNIKLSKAQLKYNQNRVEGGFLASLARMALPIVSKVLPGVGKALGIGALTGVASNVVNKIFGNGLYIKKDNKVYKVKDMGNGIFISNANEVKGKGLVMDKNKGNGLYVHNKTDNDFVDGSGFIHDITRDIPLLNILF